MVEDIFEGLQDKYFYEFFKVKPKLHLCECSFANLQHHSMEIGDDVCEYIDTDKNCSTCEKHIFKHPYYPPITDYSTIQMLIICGTDGLGEDHIYPYIDYDAINEHIMKVCSQDKQKFEDVKNILET